MDELQRVCVRPTTREHQVVMATTPRRRTGRGTLLDLTRG